MLFRGVDGSIAFGMNSLTLQDSDQSTVVQGVLAACVGEAIEGFFCSVWMDEGDGSGSWMQCAHMCFGQPAACFGRSERVW